MTTTLLFIDDWPIQYRFNIDRKLNEPELVWEGTLEDELTEGTWNFPTVWYDDGEELWKAIYIGVLPNRTISNVSNYYRTDRSEEIQMRSQVLLYAESEDGLEWRKPTVDNDLSEISENAVFAGEEYPGHVVDDPNAWIEGGPVYYDERESDPSKRVKFIYTLKDGTEGGDPQRLATSPDGREWTIDRELDLGVGQADALKSAFYRSETDSYVVGHRTQPLDRRVYFSETDSFSEFEGPELAISPDPEDPPLVQFYGMPAFEYGDIYVGLLWRFHADPAEIGKKVFGKMDCALTYSEDGKRFKRLTHDPFIPVTEVGEHGSGCVYVGSMNETDEEIRFYAGGSKEEHFRNQGLADAGLMPYRLRKDGFVSLKPNTSWGEIVTKPLDFDGTELEINVNAEHGQIEAQLVDMRGDPIEGYTYQDADPFRGDSLDWTPTWDSERLTEAVVEDPVNLALRFREAELYSVSGTFEMLAGYDLYDS